MLNKFTTLILVFVATICQAQSFDNLATLKFNDRYTNNGMSIKYDSSLSKVINKVDKNFMSADEEGMLILIETQIDRNNPTRYLIAYDPGPSDDPSFVIFYKDNKKEIQNNYLSALNLIIPGNGNLYISGHTNNMFDQKQKYQLQNGTLKETPQPFYYAGIQTELLKDFILYADKDSLKNKVAQLPKGSKVTLVLMQHDTEYKPEATLLLATPYGLCGWVKVPYAQADGSDPSVDQQYTTGIKGIFFSGD